MLTWKKPKYGKNHGSPQTAEYHYERKYRDGEAQRQQTLVSFLRHTTVTVRQWPLFLSLSLYSYTVSNHTTLYNINY